MDHSIFLRENIECTNDPNTVAKKIINDCQTIPDIEYVFKRLTEQIKGYEKCLNTLQTIERLIFYLKKERVNLIEKRGMTTLIQLNRQEPRYSFDKGITYKYAVITFPNIDENAETNLDNHIRTLGSTTSFPGTDRHKAILGALELADHNNTKIVLTGFGKDVPKSIPEDMIYTTRRIYHPLY